MSDSTQWSPDPISATDSVGQWPVAALAALFDLPAPTVELPPLWHWLGFIDHVGTAGLGADGHPAAGHLMPPMPDRRRMVAGGRLTWHTPLPIGLPLTRTSTVDNVVGKRGRSGDMVFVTVRHEFRYADRLALTEEQDVVYRSQPPGLRRPLTRTATRPGPEPDHGFELTPDEAMLFRFSALTYNSHRIHYDRPYATGVEGYPGLVVHGPLLALALLEIPRRYCDRRVVSFDYRCTGPVFVGETVVVTGRHEADRLLLDARVPGVVDSVTGSAVLR